MDLELWDDALTSFISLGVFTFFIVLVLFMLGVLRLLNAREQKTCAGLLALVMSSASVWGLTDLEIIPQLVLGFSVWALVVWAVLRIYEEPEHPP